MLPLVIVFQKEAWVFYEKKRRKRKRKERGQMSHSEIKRNLEAQVFLKFFKFSKRGI
jgi:hypothetical protein